MADVRLFVRLLICSIQMVNIHAILENIVVKAACSKTETELRSRFRVHAKSDTLGDVYALDVNGDPMVTLCSTVNDGTNTPESTGDGTDANPLTFYVRLDSNTFDPVTGPSCWKIRDAGVFTWVYRVMDSAVSVPAGAPSGLITFGEYTDYTFSCDFDNMAVNTYVVPLPIVENSLRVEAIMENAALTLVDPNDLTDQVSLSVGMSVRLKALMLPLGIDDTAIGISPHNCYMCATELCPDNMPRVRLTNDSGCPTQDFVDADGNRVSGFTGSDPTVLYSGAFELGGWAGGDFAIFHCLVEFCYQGDPDGYCTDRCDFYINRRKRREVQQNETERAHRHIVRSHQFAQSLIHVRNTDYRPPVDVKPIMPDSIRAGANIQDSDSSRCYKSVYFLTTVNLLSVIILASLVTTIVACNRYRKLSHID